jgi:4-amino-4-deoxy-L-arabinose transferase-like glycosyltransferase
MILNKAKPLLTTGWVFPMLVVAVFHIIFFSIALIYKGIYTGDSMEYLEGAENILKHSVSYNGSYVQELDPTLFSLRPPLYPLWILICKIIYDSDISVLIAQNLSSCFILALVYIRIRQNITAKRHQWLFVVGILLFPVYLIIVNIIQADFLLGLLLYFSWVFFERYTNSRKSSHLLLYNICLCGAVLTKPVMMYYWIPNLMFSVYLAWQVKKAYPIWVSLLLVLTISAWSYRNYVRTGYYHYSSIKMQNLLELNAGAIMSYKFTHDAMKEHRRAIIKKADAKKTFRERSDYLLQEAKKIIVKEPALYIKLHIRGMFNLMLAPGSVDIKNFLRKDITDDISLMYEMEKRGVFNGFVHYINNTNILFFIAVLLIGFWNILSFVLLMAAFGSNQIKLLVRVFLFILLFYIVFACGPGGYARFKTSVYPIMLFLLPFGYQVIIDFVNRFNGKSRLVHPATR